MEGPSLSELTTLRYNGCLLSRTQMDFPIEYRAGKVHQNADVFSQRPCFEKNCTRDGKGSMPAYTFPVVRGLHSKSAITGQEESQDDELLGSQQ